MDFSDVKDITIPQGKVVKITDASNAVLWSARRIPSIYQEVEWIQANANAETYLDLGFSYDGGCEIYIGQYVPSNTKTTYTFGATENSGVLRCCITFPYNDDTNKNKVRCYGSNLKNFIAVDSTCEYDALNDIYVRYKVEAFYTKNYTNNTESNILTTLKDYTMSNNLYLFAQNYNGTARFGGARKISYFKYYDKDGNLICDLIPCYRKSDGEIGMYDVVRKIFLTNAGSAKFAKGIDVA